MRSFVFAVTVLAACGDNLHPGIVVETHVAATTLAAGDRVGARCSIVDATGQPVLDDKGNPLTDTTEMVVSYEAMESFATDADGQIIAAKVGTATVRCSAPSLALVDRDPPTVTIVPGAPVRAITHLDHATVLAGEADGVSCLVFDAFDNPVTDFVQGLAISPFGAGTMLTDHTVTATLIGNYEVSCVVMDAAQVVSDQLVVLPALPASLAASLDPERTLYEIADQVTLNASAFDAFGNRVDDVIYAYASTPNVPSPSEAHFQFAADGTFLLSAQVTSQTENGVPLSASVPANVDSNGPVIECMRIDAPSQASEAYMVQQAPSTVAFPVHIGGAFNVQSVTINGSAATLNGSNFTAPVPIGFGMNFVDVVATDQFGKQNSTTCFVLAAANYTAESATMAGAVALRLDQNAIGDPNTSGLNSLNDILHTVLSSSQLVALVDQALLNANPINGGGCGIFACNPNVNYNGGTIAWDTPSSSMSLIPGGMQASVTLPNVRLSVRACGTTCCIGGSTITATASSISATINFNLQLQNGVLRASLAGPPSVSVGSVNLNGSGFCGFLVNLLQGFFTGTVRNAIQSSLTNFINSNVAPLLDQLVSSLDITTLGRSFSVPRLDNTGTVQLLLGLAFSSFDISTARALLGIGTKLTPAVVAQNRPSLGIPSRDASALLDPPGTTGAQPVGVSLYEGVLNEVLHSLWRGGYFQATLAFGSGNATIDGRLPAVAAIQGNQVQIMLGGVSATITIPGVIDTPITILFGGRATTSISLVGDTLVFGNLTINQLFVSFQASLTQNQRTALANLLTQVLQSSLGNALNKGLPAFPIPSFTLPASVAQYGLPAGAEFGITNPVLSTSGDHCVLDGGFGVRN
jgi:uncharacterized protein YejL (UPF0352 family)